MGNFSMWHGAVLAIILVMFAVPAAAVALERSERRDPRRAWLFWVLGYVIGAPVLSAILKAVLDDAIGALLFLAAAVLYTFLYYKALVRRSRDAGHGKTLAYAAVLPLLDILIPLYLLLKAPQHAAAESRPG